MPSLLGKVVLLLLEVVGSFFGYLISSYIAQNELKMLLPELYDYRHDSIPSLLRKL